MPKNPHAVALGRKGGKSRSEKKLRAVRKNVAKARQARANPAVQKVMQDRGVSRQWAYKLLAEEKSAQSSKSLKTGQR